MNFTGASSSSGLSVAQDFEPALENRAESEVGVENKDDVENGDDKSEGDQPGKFTGSL